MSIELIDKIKPANNNSFALVDAKDVEFEDGKRLDEKIAEIVTDGANGKSAYQIAVDNGFEGTEEEWLASLKGKDGFGAVDDELSETSENPLQNKVITKALNEKVDKVKEETEIAKTKAEIALTNAEKAEQNAKAYADQKLGYKVDKENGKGLSTNDYMDTDKAKVNKIIINGDENFFLTAKGTYKQMESVGSIRAIEFEDDGNGNVTITASGGTLNFVDDGNGNILLGVI